METFDCTCNATVPSEIEARTRFWGSCLGTTDSPDHKFLTFPSLNKMIGRKEGPDYLKVDIEGYELDGLPEWIESGALEKVFWSQNLIQPEYILPGGPAGYGASPEENTPRKEVRFRPF